MQGFTLYSQNEQLDPLTAMLILLTSILKQIVW